MAGVPVFLDAACLIALVRRRDALHAAAVQVMKQLAAERAPLMTSQWVLSEFLGSTAEPTLRGHSVAMVRTLAASPGTTVIEAAGPDFTRAMDLYAARPDKDWSLVDCASILICQDNGVRRVFTSDHHFTQAGLEILLQ